MLTPAQSAPSTRVPALPSVKCSTCAFPVPLSSLSDHVCSPQQHRLRGDSQPLPRARPSNAYTPSPNLASRVPFPTMATPAPRPEDYMPGGQSGMAGVGRRAFQSPAFAPVFVLDAIQQPPQGMQGRRPNPPQFLDIASTSATPPLSPNSTQSSPRSHSPRSPVSQSPINSVPVITGSRTPSPALLPRRWASRTHSNRSHSPPPRNAPTPSSTSSRPLLAQHHKNTLGQTPSVSPSPSSKNDTSHNPRAELIGPSSPTDSDSSGHGLAYDRDDGKEGTDEEKVIAGRYSLDKERVSVSSQSAYSTASRTRLTRDDLLASSPRRSHTTPTVGPRGGAGGFASPLGSASPPGSGAARSVSDAKNLRREKDKATASRPRICVRCERNIEGGRWVRTDTNKGVLCERCWKNMYLPKCRRCDKPIEQAAVYSSDGQLKGKYHRDCFSCFTCHKPFPDKSFYVYDGHPMCAFHYHEANRSLCAASACGRPIEGPCAITYVGDRYHPDCLRCAHSRCEERLEDYWEIDGVMLCERHAQRHERGVDDEEEDDVGELQHISSLRKPARLGSSETRAQKRTTRLINLNAF